jgi:hypothetical protein
VHTGDSKQPIKYINNVSEEIKVTIQKGIQFLFKNINKRSSILQNAFFSGSVKGLTSLPFFYPANVHRYSNGTELNPQNATERDIKNDMAYHVKGFISMSEYRKLVQKSWFRVPTPTQFTGFNEGTGFTFPFWSSPAITKAMTMAAMSKFQVLSRNT